MSSSARPNDTVVVPDSQSKKFSVVHIVKDELVRIQPATSVSSKYVVVIKVVE